jgi:hypothetical protein
MVLAAYGAREDGCMGVDAQPRLDSRVVQVHTLIDQYPVLYTECGRSLDVEYIIHVTM